MSKKCCPHHYCVYSELAPLHRSHVFNRGELIGTARHVMEPHAATVVCRACGLVKTWSIDKLPGWVRGMRETVVSERSKEQA